MDKIYESPDRGKTVYVRNFMEVNRTKIRDAADSDELKNDSEESKEIATFVSRLNRIFGSGYEAYGPDGEYLDGPNLNVPLLLTSAVGLGNTAEEFRETTKKIFFEDVPLDEQARNNMVRELSDTVWYWFNACKSLDLDPNALIAESLKKTEAGEPPAKFNGAP